MKVFNFCCFNVLFIFVFFLSGMSCTSRSKEPAEPDPLEITHKIQMETGKGNIVLGLFGNAMPVTVENFVKYVEDGFYDGLIFHRVVQDFVIQGGGFDEKMVQKQTREPIKLEMPPSKEVEDESGRKSKRLLISHEKHTISMARTSFPHSATSQFFITLAQTKNLDPKPDHSEPNGYAVFGKVLEGGDVVDSIGSVKVTKRAGHVNVPEEPITILKAFLINGPGVKE